MASETSRQQELEPRHHVARYCRSRLIGTDGLPIPEAFTLREGEEYLSTNWLEYFHPTDRLRQTASVRQALLDKGRTVRRTAFFLVLNAGTAIDHCSEELNREIQFVNLGEVHDPSHTGIYGYTSRDTRTAALLAESVNPSEVYPAIQ